MSINRREGVRLYPDWVPATKPLSMEMAEKTLAIPVY